MNFKSFKKVLLLVGLFYLPLQSMAWGVLGHRIVGEIASNHVNRKTCKAIKNILGNESLAMAANWADFIKSDPAYNYLGNWHYANYADQLDYQMFKDAVEKDAGPNVYTQINFLASELKNKNLEQNKKVMYLRLLIHLVGDMHQPMHFGRKEDSGGNGIKLSWFGKAANLHNLWDEHLIEFQQLSYTEYANALDFTTKDQVKKWQNQSMSTWAYESYEISRKLYSELQPEDKLSFRYNFDHIDIVNDRLLKGGVRLAGLLNQIFSN